MVPGVRDRFHTQTNNKHNLSFVFFNLSLYISHRTTEYYGTNGWKFNHLYRFLVPVIFICACPSEAQRLSQHYGFPCTPVTRMCT